jgi:hypothetical protein
VEVRPYGPFGCGVLPAVRPHDSSSQFRDSLP